MNRVSRIWAGGIALLFLALHLPFLPASLEDLDSINFALGVRRFDVAQHQPHPPGYPLFVLIAKAVHALVPSEAKALALVAVFAGTLSVVALVVLFRRLQQSERPAEVPIGATVLTVTAPLYWFTSVRPLSDLPGLAAALAVQAATLSAATAEGLTGPAFLAGLLTGLRSQVLWLTVPLIAFSMVRLPASVRRHASVRALVAFAAGALVWGIPLVWLTGGPAGYLRVFFNQGAEDLSGVAMLWTTPTPRQLVLALNNTFIVPWSSVMVAAVILVCAVVGIVRAYRRNRGLLLTLAVAFAPYLVFDLLFQETVTTRYALPAVVPLAYLAVYGADALPRRASLGLVIALACVMAGMGERALSGYASSEAPAFRLLEDMNLAAAAQRSPVLAMHRRDEFDLRRPIVWVGDRMPRVRSRLGSPPKHEWLEMVKYWNGGGAAPVWFVADPPRSDLALVDHHDPEGIYRWSLSAPELIGGTRPNEMDWYVIDRPRWYLGEGWAITPETAGVARQDGRGPGRQPISGWIRRDVQPATLMIGGRNLSLNGLAARVRIAIDGRPIDESIVAPGFFVKMLSLPIPTLDGPGAYATITVTAEAVSAGPAGAGQPDVAIEQFDVKPEGEVVLGYADGWHEGEYNPVTGKLWRWTSERATLRIRSGKRPLLLNLGGETETFRKPSHLTFRSGERILDEMDVGQNFSVKVGIPAALLENGETTVTIETSQTYVPAEVRWRSRDRRRLGLKVVDCRLTIPS